MQDNTFILSTHYQGKNPVEDIRKIAFDLCDLLDDPLYPGTLFIFYDQGWVKMLKALGRDMKRFKESVEYQESAKVQKEVNKLLMQTPMGKSRKRNLSDRLRFITIQDLLPIVENFRGDRPGFEAKQIGRFLGGDASGSRYDTPKIIEAIIRIRLIGSGVPISRLDWDALCNPASLGGGQLMNALHKVVKQYEQQKANPNVNTFMFSGAYTYPKRSYEQWKTGDWVGAFATRMFPTLLATPQSLNLTGKLGEERLDEFFEPDLAMRFYGLNPSKYTNENQNGWQDLSQNKGISAIGSNPLLGLISGALFTMNDAVTIDLPPFSNFRHFVMWIDDHLKFKLHKALVPDQALAIPLKTSVVSGKARVPGCSITKQRPQISNLSYYLLNAYLPRLLWGSIVDAWIQPDSILEAITGEKTEGNASPFVNALRAALMRGYFNLSQREALVEDLKQIALDRIAIIQDQWRQLKITKEGKEVYSFAGLWATRPDLLKSEIGASLIKTFGIKEDWIGWGLTKEADIIVSDFEELNPKVQETIHTLIEDMVDYIDWALLWPNVVRRIRAISPEELKFDLNWQAKNRRKSLAYRPEFFEESLQRFYPV